MGRQVLKIHPYKLFCDFTLTGNSYLSYVDPVIIGRSFFHSTNDFLGEHLCCVKDLFCVLLDFILDTVTSINAGIYYDFIS